MKRAALFAIFIIFLSVISNAVLAAPMSAGNNLAVIGGSTTVPAANTGAVPLADTTAPTITQFDIPTSAEAYKSFNIVVAATDNVAMSYIKISSNGTLNEQISCSGSSCSKTWTTSQATPTVYKYTIEAVDTSSNKRLSTKYITITPDRTAPVTVLSVSPTSIKRGQSTYITCTATDEAGIASGWPLIAIKKPNNAWVNQTVTSYTYTPTASDPLGDYKVYCAAKDINNNYGESAPQTLTVSATSLTVTVTASDTTYNLGDVATMTANVKYSDGTSVTSGTVKAKNPTGGDITLAYSGSAWTATYLILITDPVGTWKIDVTANDGSSNTGTGSTTAMISNKYNVNINSPLYRGGGGGITLPVEPIYSIKSSGGGGKGSGMTVNSAGGGGTLPVAPSYRRGETVNIIVDVLDADGNVKIKGATVTATIPSGSSITLFDDGGHGDGAASDGTYGNSYTIIMSDPDSWNLVVTAAKSGNSGSATKFITILPAQLTVLITAPPALNVYNRGETVAITADITYPDGSALTSGTVTATSPTGGTIAMAHGTGPTWTGSYAIAATDPAAVWTITVSAQDSTSNAGSAQRQVTISSAYTVTITSPADASNWYRGDVVSITATVKDVHGSAVTGASVGFVAPDGSSLAMTDTGTGLYTASYTIQPSDTTGSWTITVSALKTGNSGADSRNVNILADTKPPQYSFCQVNPVSGATYVKGASYDFECTWDDDMAVADVVFEFNGRAYSYLGGKISKAANIYSITLTDLPANVTGWAYKWSAKDNENNWNNTPTWNYVINKVVSTSSMIITSSPVTYPTPTRASCYETNPEAAGKLWRNGVDVTAAENNTDVILPAGTHNYICNVSETQNYTAVSTPGSLTVNKGVIDDKIAYLNLTILPGDSVSYGTTTNATAWATITGASDVIFTLYRNAAVIGSGNKVSDVGVLDAGIYDYVYNTSGGQNWTAMSITGKLTIGKIPNPVHLWLNGKLDQNDTIDYGSYSNATGTDTSGNATVGNLMLWRDGALMANPDIAMLPAGTHAYKVNSSEGLNYLANSTGVTYYLTVQKAVPGVSIDFFPSPIPYGTPAGISCLMTVGDAGATLNLWRNGSIVNTSTSGEVRDDTVLAAGGYEYACEYVETQNFTGMTIPPVQLIVDKAVPTLWADISPASPVTYGTPTTVAVYSGNTDASAVVKIWYHDNLGGPWMELINDTAEVYPVGEWLHYWNITETENFTSTYGYTSAFYEVTPVTATMTLLLDGSDSDLTIERGAIVNATGVLSVAGMVDIAIDGVSSSGTSPYEFDIDSGSLALGAHTVNASSVGDTNYTGAWAIHTLTVQDTIAPVITILSPENITYNSDTVDLNWTTSEPVVWAGYSLDGGANITLTDNVTLTPGPGTHTIMLFANDSAGYTGTDSVTFTMECVSKIYNSTIDSTYYAAHVGNLYLPDSTIYCSAVNDSEIINSTVVDSTILRSFVKGKNLLGMWIEDSWVDPTYGNSSGYSRISADSNVTDSSIWWSNVTDRSNITDSGVNGTSVTHSNLLTTAALNSTIADSDIEYSTVNLSTVTGSDIMNATLTNSTVISTQFCVGIETLDAVIIDNRMTSGYIIYNGVTYDTPTNITAMCNPPDTTAPAINRIWNTTAVYAGQPAGFSINATDNVAVANVTVNGTLAAWTGGDIWSTTINVPGVDGLYRWPVIATDYAGNSAGRNISILVNTSADPNVTIDVAPPMVSAIWPSTATMGVSLILSANVSDDTAVANCTLFVNGNPVANMTDGLPSNATTVKTNWTFGSVGSYAVHAGCYDMFDNWANGTATTITVSEYIPGGGGGGLPPPTVPRELTVSVSSPIIVDIGTTGVFVAQVTASGRTDIKDVRLSVGGAPYTFTFVPELTTIGPGASQTFTVNVIVPADAKPGVSKITITAKAADGLSGDTTADLIVKMPGQTAEEVKNVTNVTNVTTPQPPAAPSGLAGALLAATTSPLTALGILLAIIGILGWLWYKRPELFTSLKRRKEKATNGGSK